MNEIKYVSERITNIAELEKIIGKCCVIAQEIKKESPDNANSLMLVELLEKASGFEFHIERRKTTYSK